MFKAKFISEEPLKARFVESPTFRPTMTEVIEIPIGDIYEGDYVITPSDSVQVLPTNNKISAQDFIINPIPNTWGRISWNGSAITVS